MSAILPGAALQELWRLVGTAETALKARIKRRQIGPQLLRCVAPRIDGDEDDAQSIAVRPELRQQMAQYRVGTRARPLKNTVLSRLGRSFLRAPSTNGL